MRRKIEEQNSYEARMLCRNCDHNWIEEIEKGTYIRYEKDNNYMINNGAEKNNRKYFTCPMCGANKKIARLPLRTIKRV